MKLADRMSRLGTETAFEVLAKAKKIEAEGKTVIHLEIGEPDFGTPANISKAAIEALNQGFTHYAPSPGLPELRDTIAKYMSRTRGLNYKPEEVVITPGGKPVMFFVILALINKGDEVIYPNPGFPIYESMINFVGGKAVPIQLCEDKNFAFDPEELRKLVTDKTKLLILNTPQNPTGGILTKSDIEKIAEIIRDKDIMVLSDEIYSRLIFEGEHFSIAQVNGFKDRTIILDGYSKYYAMTGWRIGYAMGDAGFLKTMQIIGVVQTISVNTMVQMASEFALRNCDARVREIADLFSRRVASAYEAFSAIPGIRTIRPGGSFYLFLDVLGTGMDGTDFAVRMLRDAGVVVIPGDSFGPHCGGYVRIACTVCEEKMREAAGRIKNSLR